MNSTLLPTPTDFTHCSKYSQMLNLIYQEYESEVKGFNKTLKINDKFIYFPLKSPLILNKDEIFWHITGLETNEVKNLNMYICNGDEKSYEVCSNLCGENCRVKKRVYTLNNRKQKHFCVYRASRIKWIPAIIKLYNTNNKFISSWYNTIQVPKKGKVTQFYIRFKEKMCDYIIIFEVKIKDNNIQSYNFITAFPIFFFGEKEKFDKSYNSRINL